MSYVTRDHFEAGIRRYFDVHDELKTYDLRSDKPIRVFREGGLLLIETQGQTEPLVSASTELLRQVWVGCGEPDGGIPLIPDSAGAAALKMDHGAASTAPHAAAKPDKDQPGPSKYLDPAKNPYIPGGSAPRPASEKGEELDPHLDPRTNPLIRTDPKA